MKEQTPPVQCPCGSGRLFTECCRPVIEKHERASSPEELMRSRYTAFTLGNNRYLMESWAEETRPREINADEGAIQWLGLTVESCEGGEDDSKEGTVTFTARFLSGRHLCSLHERSRFIRKKGLWFYLDGETRSTTEKPGRNSPCPCGSGKKYKRCCCQADCSPGTDVCSLPAP